MVRALVVDVGTTSLRTAVVSDSGVVANAHQRKLTVTSPQPGEVELDGAQIAALSLELARATLSDAGDCDVLGIANQRATTLLFDVRTGEAVGPTLGWQDLRTVIDCLILQGSGIRVAPNQSATKAKWLLEHTELERGHLRFATLETFIAWHLSRGATYASDHSNAAVTGLVSAGARGWDPAVLDAVGLDPTTMPELVDTMGSFGRADALSGSPEITALVGDQSASLFGQCCIEPGSTKVTFGTGAMLDLVSGANSVPTLNRFDSGCFPIVARSQAGELTWGVEGIVLSAGTCIEWLRDDLGLISTAEESGVLANSVTSADGVSFVPALLGLGTPAWDFGARGAFFGLTRGSSRAHLVRAVLEGIAQRGADLVAAAETEIGRKIDEVRIDGGMSANSFLVQSLADHSGCVVTVSPEREATTRGAGLMALVGASALNLSDVASMWSPQRRVEPQISDDERSERRAQWATVVSRAEKTIPELSSVSF
jgi:glycerol kinase